MEGTLGGDGERISGGYPGRGWGEDRWRVPWEGMGRGWVEGTLGGDGERIGGSVPWGV